VPPSALLTPQREKIAAQIRDEAAAQADALGVELVDVRLRRADLPTETSQAIYDRMTSERVREANDLRAQGPEWGQEIRAKADRERAVLLSEAERESQISRGVADAEASRILADVYAQDPDFFDLYRTLQVYRAGLTVGVRSMMCTPAPPAFSPWRCWRAATRGGSQSALRSRLSPRFPRSSRRAAGSGASPPLESRRRRSWARSSARPRSPTLTSWRVSETRPRLP
jgi:modulator of FtsH protease HflC